MRNRRLTTLLVSVALFASACNVHIVGDSTAYLVKLWAEDWNVTISGSPVVNCGFTTMNGDRIPPNFSGPGYPVCLTDWSTPPDETGDVIFAFVSIHDAMCSTVDGCLPIDASAYGDVHDDLVAMGHDVVWVEVPIVGSPAMQARLNDLNAAVAAELGCTLVDKSVREAPTWDGIHYLPEGGWTVGYRLAVLANGSPPVCP